VDADTLALSAEGLLEDEEERSVQQHVSECGQCAEQLTELAGVARVLAEVPAVPLPDTVVARLDAALEAEAAARRERLAGTAPVAAPPGRTASVVSLRSRFTAHRWVPYLAAAAAAVVVLGGGAAVARGLMSPAAESGAAAPAEGPGTTAAPDAIPPYRPVLLESGTGYTEDDLAGQAAGVLADADPGAADEPESPSAAPEVLSEGDPAAVPAEVSSCAQGLRGDTGEQPTLIDLAEFRPGGDGDPREAWALYFPAGAAGDPESYEVVVVSADCAGGADAADAVLAETTVPAP
jgi:hypothetical protein